MAIGLIHALSKVLYTSLISTSDIKYQNTLDVLFHKKKEAIFTFIKYALK